VPKIVGPRRVLPPPPKYTRLGRAIGGDFQREPIFIAIFTNFSKSLELSDVSGVSMAIGLLNFDNRKILIHETAVDDYVRKNRLRLNIVRANAPRASSKSFRLHTASVVFTINIPVREFWL
jgi:hypothetical protein